MQTSIKTTSEASGATFGKSRFANGVLITSLALSGLWFLYAILSHKPHLYQKLLPAAAAAFCLLVLRARPSIRLIAALALLGVWGGLYSAEVALRMIDPVTAKRKQAAQQAGIPFDPRTRLQVIMDFRRKHVVAYPPFIPMLLLNSPLSVDGTDTVLVSGLSNAFTVSCNESGQFLTFTTDEHGFANPPGIWPKGRADIAIIGDSFTVGECVPPADNIGSQLRRVYPETISLAARANGPLLELATLKEYSPALKPKQVLWFFYEGNDMEDLEVEKQSPILMRYLDRSFSQALIEKQASINKAVAAYFEQALAATQAVQKKSWREKLTAFFTLENVRLLAWGFMHAKFGFDRPRGADFELFERVLREAQRVVGEWGGQFTLVYLPAPLRYQGQFGFSPSNVQILEQVHSKVLSVAKKLDIRVIDVTRAFSDVPGSASAKHGPLFYPYVGHYTPEGYHIAGQEVLKGLPAANPQVSQ
jgi:hypothetical protein